MSANKTTNEDRKNKNTRKGCKDKEKKKQKPCRNAGGTNGH